MPAREKLLAAAQRLHAYLLSRHHHRGILRGPGAVRWYDYLVGQTGFQQHETGKAINYFDKPRGKAPNNSIKAAWVFARLWQATADARYLEHDGGFICSKGDYGFLRDSRSCPRPMAMTLFHLLYGAGSVPTAN